MLTVLVVLAFPMTSQARPWPPAPPLERAAGDVAALPPSVHSEPSSGGFRVTFTLSSGFEAKTVHLAGDFNGWSPQATPLERGADGRWTVSVPLKGGVRFYKLVVDGERWIADPANDETAPDGYGGENSVLRLGALGNLASLDLGLGETGLGELRLGDGAFGTSALEHDPARPLYRQRLSGGRTLVRYRTFADDVEAVALCVRGLEPAAMRRALRTDRFQYWETELAPIEGDLEYTFVVSDGGERASHPEVFRLEAAEAPALVTPDWAKNAIWYQIMVDRFRSGSEQNDPDPVRPWTSDWTVPSEFEGRDGQTFWRWFVFQRLYGGDLQGVRQRLDYLVELGVTALYLNPIFQAPGHHKYNATSYLHVDEHYGVVGDYAEAEAQEDLLDPSTWTWTASDRVFLELVQELHGRGIKVILDGVFNHVGDQHTAFRDVREKGRASRFADWFDVRSWEPFEYAGWAGFGQLPVFKKSAEGFASIAVKEHIFAITRRWMDPDGDGDPSDGIDGWRLDVPNEVAQPFWREWRTLVKSIDPDAFIAGEIWDRADTWLDGRHFDSVMNYPFAATAVAWVGNEQRKLAASECDRRLAELRLAYPREANFALMNLVDSHDTDRMVSMMKNPDRDYDRDNREQDGAPYDGSKPGPVPYRRARLLALFQMTYVGAPMVYYGDEVGMWGADDPANRKPMLWKDLEPYSRGNQNRVDERHLAHYKQVIALRRGHSALRTGSFRTILTDDAQDVLAFVREDERELVLVALNASSRVARVALPALDGTWRCVYGDDRRRASGGRVRIPAIDGRVWVKTK